MYINIIYNRTYVFNSEVTLIFHSMNVIDILKWFQWYSILELVMKSGANISKVGIDVFTGIINTSIMSISHIKCRIRAIVL